MLELRNLYKKHGDSLLNDINIKIEKGSSVNLECSSETSDILFKLILGKEMPGRGEIFLNGEERDKYLGKNPGKIGVIFKDEGLYERLTVEEYIKTFSEIFRTKINYREIMLKLALLDIAETKIKKLNYSQKRRLCLARERLKEPELVLFQEPLIDMDREGIKIILENIEEMCLTGTTVINTSVSFKDIMLLGGQSYILDETGLRETQETKESLNEAEDGLDDRMPVYKIEKIPARLDERILLFDPVEIDYIESEQGISNLSVRGEKFPCTLSLNDLESRLEYLGFFRSHRSYLVNLQRVREVITWTRNSYSLNLDDKAKSSIPLSKGRMEELKKLLKI